jgi:methylglutaconyl-CoA hydratase
MISVNVENSVATITLKRGSKGNSYDRELAQSLTAVLTELAQKNFTSIILTAEGKNFCTGADLDWMEKCVSLTPEESIKDLSVIRDMYAALLSCPFPIIGRVFGKIRGGGLGLTAACDIVVAHRDTDFSLSQIKHRLIPGIITPLVVGKISDVHFVDWANSTRVVSVTEARKAGLVQFLEGELRLQDILRTAAIHPFRRNPAHLFPQLDHYMKLSSEHLKKMIRAPDIS